MSHRPLYLLDRHRIMTFAPRQVAAVAVLCRQADDSLTAGPFSVTHKELTPPSGDKHDYMSMSTYVWPDPTKPDGLPYIMRDGQRNPENDKYDDGPLRRMCEAVQVLTLAGVLTGKEHYSRRAALLLRTWFLDPATKMNPHLQFGQCVPGACTGHRRGIIDTATHFPLLLEMAALLPAAAWSDADHAALMQWMSSYLDWLLTSEFGKVESQINNNHAVACDVLVTSLALHTGRHEVARHRAEDAKTRRVAVQIWPDGSMPREIERTMGLNYVCWNLLCFMQLARLAARVGVDLWGYASSEGRSIRRAAEWALPYLDMKTKPWPWQQINPMDP